MFRNSRFYTKRLERKTKTKHIILNQQILVNSSPNFPCSFFFINNEFIIRLDNNTFKTTTLEKIEYKRIKISSHGKLSLMKNK